MSAYEDDIEDPDPWIVAPSKAIKGRGAITNIAGRYEIQTVETIDDGWNNDDGWNSGDGRNNDDGSPKDADQQIYGEKPRHFKTEVTHETAKTILSRNQSPDLPF